MRKQIKLLCFFIMFSFLTFINFYFSGLIYSKILKGWHFSNRLVEIVCVKNTGAAFSIMQDSIWILIILSVSAFILILYYFIKNLEQMNIKWILFFSFLNAGIIGNLCERLFLGHVRDFFNLTFINFPVFNISDIFINIGVIGIIILILCMKKPLKL